LPFSGAKAPVREMRALDQFALRAGKRRICVPPHRFEPTACASISRWPEAAFVLHAASLSCAEDSVPMKDTLGILLAGGAGERLYPLTRDRAKPAVTFGGIYRIIDITLSNCVNSGMRRVYILTQYKALSLNRQIREGWNILGREIGEFIEILPPMQRVSQNWYMGTADAVYQNIYSIGSEQPKYVIILAGDHIYKMNYARRLQQHKDSGADVTVATLVTDAAESRHFGVVDIDRENRIIGFLEKPKQTELRSPYDPAKISASMGIYIFNTDVLIPVLLKDAEDADSSHDFGKDILPKMLHHYRVFSFNFVDENKKEALYWRDVGTLEAYYEANMDLVSVSPVFNLYDEQWPIRTHQRQYPPAKFVFAESERMGHALDSLVSSGCIISGGTVQNCVLSPNVRVNSYAEIENSILFSHVNVGRSCRIRKAIIDRDVHIPEGTSIGYDTEADRERYFVTDSGITVVTRDYSLFENPVTVDYFTSE
jgi:glucose-1-phosphate adenylyltransferase